MKKQTLKDKILAFLKGGDEAKISRFEVQIEKFIDNQIDLRHLQIADLEERLEDQEQNTQEAITNVDVNKIQTIESTKAYCEVYLKKLLDTYLEHEKTNDEIEKLQTEIMNLTDVKTKMFS